MRYESCPLFRVRFRSGSLFNRGSTLMAEATRTSLAKRWSTAQVEQVVSLLDRPPIDLLALERLVGRTAHDEGALLDLRALPLSRSIDLASIEGLDLSHSHWPQGVFFTRVQATRCRLAAIRISTALAERFDSCDFRLARFSECLGMPGTVFADCLFDGSHFKAGQFHGCLFQRCSFSEASIPRTDFEDCVFEQCRFDGTVFKEGAFGRCRFIGLRTNFRYMDLERRSKGTYIGDTGFTTIDLGETNMVGVTFE